MVISLENLYVDIGAQRVKRSLRVSSSDPFEDKLVHRVWSLENWFFNSVYNFSISYLEQGVFLDWKLKTVCNVVGKSLLNTKIKNKNELTCFYYINTNEIPSELSHENLIWKHVIFTCENITVACFLP